MIEICYLAASIVSVNRQDCSLVGIGPANCVIVFPHNNFDRPVVFQLLPQKFFNMHLNLTSQFHYQNLILHVAAAVRPQPPVDVVG